MTWLINTGGETAGDLGGRALDGEKITGGDVVLSLGINAVKDKASGKLAGIVAEAANSFC